MKSFYRRALPGRSGGDHNPTMNLNSKYFDRIRINPDGAPWRAAMRRPASGTAAAGRAAIARPKGRQREGEYHNFCLDHVREYNKSYNYFAGMADDDIVAYQTAAATGHRPTWTMGVKNGSAADAAEKPRTWGDTFGDPVRLLRRRLPPRGTPKPRKSGRSRTSSGGLSMPSTLTDTKADREIKSRYKELVKRLHPDANGGDRSSEDRLRQIIQAYHYLRSAGFC